ncbi:MAG: DEAD/DEAH box helicase, partial [Nocardioidaceae bacterium]
RVSSGEFRPGGHGPEWCDAEVLRRIRRRSLAALRHEVEPVETSTLGRFLPVWQHVGGRLRGVDGTLTVIEQLAGCPVPSSALEPLVLGSRVIDYSPAWLDQLTTSGEVIWAGSGPLPGADGWVSLHLAESAPLTLPDFDSDVATASPLHQAILEALAGGGAYFFRQLSDSIGAQDDRATTAALWDLVWAGYLSNDTLLPLRTVLSAGRTTHRGRRSAPRGRLHRPGRGAGRAAMPSRAGPPTAAGRWSLLPDRASDPTRRAHAFAEALLDRHGIVTRGAATSERIPGGFAAVYKVLSAFEEAGHCRRGYFVAGLGAAQFGAPGAVDRLRSFTATGQEKTDVRAVALAATDPANPFGAALAWPDRLAQPGAAPTSGHRPGRKAGALVVLVDGGLVLYVERGGRTLLTFSDDPERVQPAVDALALAVRDGALGRLTVERADGAQILGSALGAALESAGFHATPRGLRLRA